MDNLYTSGDVARMLGTSVPRVLRAARRGTVPIVSRGNRTMFDTRAVAALRQRWGAAPGIAGLRREEVLALAALARRPLGLASARALGRAAGLSPTATGRALRRLSAAGYVERRTVRVVEGRVRERPVWMVRFGSPVWTAVASRVGTVVLPQRTSDSPPHRVPGRLGHLFWNEDLGDLDLDRHAVLIADRVLRADDPEALAWMRDTLSAAAIERATRRRGLDPRRAHLGHLLARPSDGLPLPLVEPTTTVAGLRVAGLGDLLAMKLKVIRERGELRDYFDVLAIEREAHRRVEEGIALALRKYRPRGEEAFVASLLRSLGYLDDVEEDPAVPMSKAGVAAYWAVRTPEITANLSRWA
jgi:DNA-binding transcriptional ArsR family regulator